MVPISTEPAFHLILNVSCEHSKLFIVFPKRGTQNTEVRVCTISWSKIYDRNPSQVVTAWMGRGVAWRKSGSSLLSLLLTFIQMIGYPDQGKVSSYTIHLTHVGSVQTFRWMNGARTADFFTHASLEHLKKTNSCARKQFHVELQENISQRPMSLGRAEEKQLWNTVALKAQNVT